MIRSIQREMGSSVLFVTHDMAVNATLTDRLGVMYAGCLVEEGPTAELFEVLGTPTPALLSTRSRASATTAAHRPHRLAAEPRRSAAGLPLPPPLPAGERPLPAGTARHDHAVARRRVACHAVEEGRS